MRHAVVEAQLEGQPIGDRQQASVDGRLAETVHQRADSPGAGAVRELGHAASSCHGQHQIDQQLRVAAGRRHRAVTFDQRDRVGVLETPEPSVGDEIDVDRPSRPANGL